MAPLYRQRAATVEAMQLHTVGDAERIIQWVDSILGANCAVPRKGGILVRQDAGVTDIFIQKEDYVVRTGDRTFTVRTAKDFASSFESVVAR